MLLYQSCGWYGLLVSEELKRSYMLFHLPVNEISERSLLLSLPGMVAEEGNEYVM
jgi:hypothetical protein